MNTVSQNIIDNYQIRKTAKQKAAFREFLSQELSARGMNVQVIKDGSTNNVLVGDISSARVLYTAHYDTCAVMPLPNFITPKNFLFYILFQLLLTALIFASAAVLGFGIAHLLGVLDGLTARMLSLAFVYVMLFLMMFGPANKNTMNDNTSGVVSLVELMSALSADERQKAAFVFFDLEESGLVGSSRFAKRFRTELENKLIVNLDCVGDGDNILLVRNKRLLQDQPLCAAFDESFAETDGYHVLFEKPSSAMYPSDQLSFKKNAAIAALNRKPVVGYYMNRIHTPRDTILREENLRYIVDALCSFNQKL